MLSPVTFRLLAHPFRLDGAGAAATVEQGSEADVDQALQVSIGTVVGERDMAWAFGLPDPGWHGISAEDVQAVINLYGPYGVTITDVSTTPVTETSADVQVVWSWPTPDVTDDVTG